MGGVPHVIDPRRAVLRIFMAMGSGILVGILASFQRLPSPLPFLIGWNTGGAVQLLLAWLLVVGSDETTTEARAGAEDPGRTLVYGIVLLASSVSLVAALYVTHNIDMLKGAAVVGELLCLLTVALAWGLTHTAFTLRYAHLFYRDDGEGGGGMDFPGTETPTYLDFAYFAFTIGMCFQTSDVCISTRQFRKVVLLHAIISFGYNTAIIAFVLNLVFGKVS